MGKFRYVPKIQDVLDRLPQVNGAAASDPFSQITEEMYRRDRSLEDYLDGLGSKEYATVVVAAFDTHQSGRDNADFVCDATADDATILEAVNSIPLSSFGIPIGKIVFLEGSYTLSGSIAFPLGAFVLAGTGFEGYGSVFSAPSGTFDIFDLSAGAYVELRDLSVLGLQTGDTFTGAGAAYITDSSVVSYGGSVVPSSVPVCRLRRATVEAAGSADVLACGQLSARSSTVAAAGTGLCWVATSVGFSDLMDVNFTGPSTGAYIVDISLSGRAAIRSCSFSGSGGDSALHVTGNGNIVDIVDNDFLNLSSSYAIGQHGVALESVSNGVIKDNRFGSLGGSGLYDALNLSDDCDSNIISHNTFPATTSSLRSFVRIEDSTCDNNIVLYNVFGGGAINDLDDNGTGTVSTVPAGSLPSGIGTGADEALVHMGSIATGPKGDSGAPGAAGTSGPDEGVLWMGGNQGPIGLPGPTGPTGATGATGAVGPGADQAFTFMGGGGSKGDPGATGPAGAPGATGAAGAPADESLVWMQGGGRGPAGSPGPACPTYVPPSVTYTVYLDTQVLFALPIDIDGALDLEGALVEVS